MITNQGVKYDSLIALCPSTPHHSFGVATRLIQFITCYMPHLHYTLFQHHDHTSTKIHSPFNWEQILKQHYGSHGNNGMVDNGGGGIILYYQGCITTGPTGTTAFANSNSTTASWLLEKLILSKQLTTITHLVKRSRDTKQQHHSINNKYHLGSIDTSLDQMCSNLQASSSHQLLLLDLFFDGTPTEINSLCNDLQYLFDSLPDSFIVMGHVTSTENKNDSETKLSEFLSDPVLAYLKYILDDKYDELADNVIDGFLFLNNSSKAKLYHIILQNMEDLFLEIGFHEFKHFSNSTPPLFQLILAFILFVYSEEKKGNNNKNNNFFSKPIHPSVILVGCSYSIVWDKLRKQVEQIIVERHQSRLALSKQFIELRNKL